MTRIPIKNIISIDETSIDTHISSRIGWSENGKKIIIPKTNQIIRYTVISTVGYQNVIYNKIIKGSCNGEIFLKFIKKVLSRTPKNTSKTLLLDNAPIHHYKKLQNFVEGIKNVDLLFNVPYSPESNPIEKVFSEVKMNLRTMYIDNDNIIKKIQKSFNLVKKKNIQQYFKKSINFY